MSLRSVIGPVIVIVIVIDPVIVAVHVHGNAPVIVIATVAASLVSERIPLSEPEPGAEESTSTGRDHVHGGDHVHVHGHDHGADHVHGSGRFVITSSGRVARYFFAGCFAITRSLILSYVACGTIFFETSCVFIAYGRPAMIFLEYASPMPGSAFS